MKTNLKTYFKIFVITILLGYAIPTKAQQQYNATIKVNTCYSIKAQKLAEAMLKFHKEFQSPSHLPTCATKNEVIKWLDECAKCPEIPAQNVVDYKNKREKIINMKCR